MSAQDPTQQEGSAPKHQKPIPKGINFSASDLELYQTGQFSDAELICKDQIFKVHRVEWQEGESRVLELKEYFSSDSVEIVLEFIYSGQLKSQRFPSEEYVDTLCHYNYLASLADYFLVDGMNNYILRNMGHFLGEKLNTICNTAICPRDLDCDQRYIEEPSVYPEDKFKELEDDGFPSDLCVSIRQAYAMPCATQHVYVDFIHAARMHTLKNEHVQKLIKDVPAFGCDLLDAMTKGPLSNAFDGNKTFEMWKGVSNPADVLDDNMDPLRAADTWPHLSSLPVESQLPAAFVAGRATTRAAGTPGAHRP